MLGPTLPSHPWVSRNRRGRSWCCRRLLACRDQALVDGPLEERREVGIVDGHVELVLEVGPPLGEGWDVVPPDGFGWPGPCWCAGGSGTMGVVPVSTVVKRSVPRSAWATAITRAT